MSLPSSYTAVRDRIDVHASQMVTQANNRLQTAITNHVNDIHAFQQLKHERNTELMRLTMDYMQTGIAKLPDNDYKYHTLHMHGVGWGHMSFSWWRYFRDLAKELRRPFVAVNTNRRITVQKFAYTRPLVAQFLLIPSVARPTDTWRKKYWSFWLGGSEEELKGDVLFEHWLKCCAEEPDMRRALRLP